jgi:hypothetical protein
MGARGPKSVASLSIVTAELPKIGDASLKPPRPLRAHGKAMWTRIVASYDFSGSPAAAEILAHCCDALDLRGGDQGFYSDGRFEELHELTAQVYPALRIRPREHTSVKLRAALQ